MQKAIFLDRDGTINPDDKGYISKPEDFILFPFSATAIKIFVELGFLVFVVSNQSGIARGYFSEEDLQLVHQKMINDLQKEGACINQAYYCPYLENGAVPPYNIITNLRKPDIGMFIQAKKDFDIEIKNSFMIGDKLSDIEFAHNAGIKSILLLTGEGKNEVLTYKEWTVKPDYIAENLLTAAFLIKILHNQSEQ